MNLESFYSRLVYPTLFVHYTLYLKYASRGLRLIMDHVRARAGARVAALPCGCVGTWQYICWIENA